jgi:hypothetical protein
MPCGGKNNILPAARIRLIKRNTEAVARLALNVDSDTNADGSPSVQTPLHIQAVTDLLRQCDGGLTQSDDSFLLDGGATRIDLIRWLANDPPSRGLPNQQTLERLVCAALSAAYPERGECVQDGWILERTRLPSV